MAIYHAHFQIIKRASGQSAIASSAYRSGHKLHDDINDKVHDYRRKKGVVYHEVMLCDNAPEKWKDEEILWNDVEKTEKSAKARLAREADFALPKELDQQQQIALARDYVQRNFVDHGMCAQLDVHNPHGDQPHFHIMLTLRAVDEHGQFLPKTRTEFVLDDQGNRIPIIDPKTGKQKINTKKRGERQWRRITVSTTDWNDQETLIAWRHDWAESVNRALQNANVRDEKGNYVTISEKTLAEQGIDRIPTIHEGVATRAMEKRGISTERGDTNRDILAANIERDHQRELESELAAERQNIEEQTAKLQAELDEVNRALAANLKAIELREKEQETLDLWAKWLANQEAQEEETEKNEQENSRMAVEEEEGDLLSSWIANHDQEDMDTPSRTARVIASPPKPTTPQTVQATISKSRQDVFSFSNSAERLQMLRDIAHAGERAAADSSAKTERTNESQRHQPAQSMPIHTPAPDEPKPTPKQRQEQPKQQTFIPGVFTQDNSMTSTNRPPLPPEPEKQLTTATMPSEQERVQLKKPVSDEQRTTVPQQEQKQPKQPTIAPAGRTQAAPTNKAVQPKTPEQAHEQVQQPEPAPERPKRHFIKERRKSRNDRGMGR